MNLNAERNGDKKLSGNRNDNDNDNDTPEKSHIGQMRAWPFRQECPGPWPHKKESVLQVKLALLARCKNKLLWTESSAQR